VAAAITVALCWGTGLRQATHAALLTVAVLMLLPLLVIAGGLLVLMAVGLVVGLSAAPSGDGDVSDTGAILGAALVEGGAWLTRRYYGFLGRRRHPAFWGVAAGVLAGGLLLAAAIAAIVVPGEMRTARVLAEFKGAIDRLHRDKGRFPAADANGHLARAALEPAAAPGDLVRDGFGRPLRYEIDGRWGMVTYRLVSLGFDGQPGGDDLCLAGANRLGRWAGKVADWLQLVDGLQFGSATLGDRLAGVRALGCDPETP